MGTDVKQQVTLAAYEEICKSYHAIDDFRMKLLGLLPLASLVGLLLVANDTLIATSSEAAVAGNELIGFAGIFAAALTLALFGYEIGGIQRTHNLITEGRHIEESLGIVHGQFHVCEEEHKSSPLRALNVKLIPCIIYSMVIVAWCFITLRFGFGIETATCVRWAAGTGLVVAGITYFLVRTLTPSQRGVRTKQAPDIEYARVTTVPADQRDGRS